MTDELKTCPFCGGEAKVLTPTICLGDNDADVDWLKVICSKCGVSAGFSRFRNHDPRSADFLRAKSEAITAWNTRAEDTTLQQRVRELEEAAIRLHSALAAHTCYGCPSCPGDCSSANPPVLDCPTQRAIEAYRTFDAALKGVTHD